MSYGLSFKIGRLMFACVFSLIAIVATFSQSGGSLPAAISSPSSVKPESAPTIQFSPGRLDFGDQVVDSTSAPRAIGVTVTAGSGIPIKIVGTTSGEFDVSSKSCDLKGSGACTVSVTFSPKQAIEFKGFLNITQSTETTTLTQLVDLTGHGVLQCFQSKSIFTREGFIDLSPVLIVVGLYLIGIALLRWNMIARPTRNLLQSEIEAVRNRVAALVVAGNPNPVVGSAQVLNLLTRAEEFIRDKNLIAMLPDYLLWNRGQELAGWGCVHEAEELMVSFLPPAIVEADLERAELDLRQAGTPTAIGLADKIQVALTASSPLPADRLRALLGESLGLLYDRSDTDFASLISWQNKTVWLVGCGLLFIASLAAALQHEAFFLLGAAGGLLSRLSRSLNRADVPTDYGASWTTLFLSPVVGALAGWSGVLLIIVGSDLGIIGSAFSKITWCNPYAPIALGAALLFGTSERAFDGVLSQLEDKIKTQPESTQAPQPSALNIITPAALPGGSVNQPYDLSLVASGGNSPYKWMLTAGALVAGLNLDSRGRITGTPTVAGLSTFTLQVADSASKTKSQDFTLSVG